MVKQLYDKDVVVSPGKFGKDAVIILVAESAWAGKNYPFVTDVSLANGGFLPFDESFAIIEIHRDAFDIMLAGASFDAIEKDKYSQIM